MNRAERTGREARSGRALSRGGVLVCTVFGVRVYADWSVLIIFFLVFFNLAAGLFPSWHPDWSPALVWGTALGAALLFFASILVHELSHALVARKSGIPVRRITLFLFGGMAHMEGEPTSPGKEFLIAVVGPITSIAIGVVAIVIGSMLAGTEFSSTLMEDPERASRSLGPAASLFLWLGPINVMLGLFNLVPGFPLDGGRVFRSIAWWITGDLRKATRWASGAGQVFAWVLMGWGVMSVARGSAGQGVWLLLIGWFLNNAARVSYAQLVIREELHDVPLSEVMRTRFSTLLPDTSVEDLVRDELMASDQRSFPVVAEDGRLVGLVCLEDVRKVPLARWRETRVSSIMTPVAKLETLPPSASADRALETLGHRGVDQIPVLEQGRPVGLVRSQDIVKWLALHGNDVDAMGTLRTS